jgi:CRP/FNR family cyclic AMP-dependent transcriptional regulator
MVAQELRSLDAIDLFEALNPAERAALEKQCRWKTYSPNQVIVEKGDESTEVVFILDGDVRIANYSTTGREITYATLGPGAFFGEISALDQRPRSASVAALSGCALLLCRPRHSPIWSTRHPPSQPS